MNSKLIINSFRTSKLSKKLAGGLVLLRAKTTEVKPFLRGEKTERGEADKACSLGSSRSLSPSLCRLGCPRLDRTYIFCLFASSIRQQQEIIFNCGHNFIAVRWQPGKQTDAFGWLHHAEGLKKHIAHVGYYSNFEPPPGWRHHLICIKRFMINIKKIW